MQSTKPLYTSIRNIPAGRLLGNADGATGPAQALGDVAARALLGLGTAALAATGDFDAAGAAASVASSLSAHVAAADPHGDRAYAASLVSGLSAVYQPLDSDLTAIAALSTTTYGRALLTLADAAAGQSALGLGNSALATVLATGTDRSVQVRNGTGNSYTDSLLTVAANGGISAGASITAGTNFYTTSYGGGIGAGGTHMTFENGYTNFSQRGVFTAASASVVPVTIKAAASQSGNLFEIRNSANTLTTWMRSDNHLVIGATGVARTATAISLNGDGSSHGCISLRGAPDNAWGFYAIGYDSTRDASTFVTYGGRRLVLGEHTHTPGVPFSGSSVTPRLMYAGGYWRADPKWFMGNGETHATPSNAYLSATGGSGANVAGASFYYDAGQGTGTGTGGSHVFRVAPAGSAGSSLNTLATALSINSNSVIGLGGNTSSDPALKKSSTALQVRLGDDSAFTSLYTGTQRVYDQAGNTAYLALSHDGTEGSVNTNGGALRLSAGVETITCVGGSTGYDVWRFENSTNPILRTRAGAIIGFAGSTSSATAALDTAIARRSAGAIESNNGTAGTLRDVYARTFYGIAQAATDTPGCDKGAASQSANLREWQDSTGAVLASVSENGYFTTRKNAAPADAEIATGESAYWFDSTNGAAKFMIKAKQADGTVVTGSVALA